MTNLKLKSRRFYACSVGEPEKGYDEENLERIIHNNAFILHGETKQKGVYSEIKPSDILILKYKKKFIAFGEALELKKIEGHDWNLFAPVKHWYFKDPNNTSIGTDTYGIGESTDGGGMYGTVKELNASFALIKIKEIDKASQLYIEVIGDLNKQKEMEEMKEYEDLLQYKKQIILQGPPGTGKTRLAKEIAKQFTLPKNLGSPSSKIDEFLKKFDANDTEVIAKRAELKSLMDEFLLKFPKDRLKDLTLEDYSFGTGTNESFCWWLEYVLWEFGLYSGFAKKFLIFWKKEIDAYEKHGFLKGIENDDEAMEKMAEQLSNVANNIHLDEASKYLGNGFILKLLNTYNPEIYFPINNEKGTINALKLLGVDYSNLNFLEKSKRLQKEFLNRKNKLGSSATSTEFMGFLFRNFDMKGNIVIEKDEVITTGEFKVVQFHPAYQYEDFVRGITIKTNGTSLPEYVVENRILAEFAQKAIDNPSGSYVLIIDEINRANLPSVLGELIYALEYRFDKLKPEETSVESLYALKVGELEDRILLLPNNFFIIGTMNSADRSVGHIDYAIRRRFAFVDVLPKILDNIPFEKQLFKRVSELFVKDIYADVFQPSEYLSSEFRPEDVWLGHSYFIMLKDDKGKDIPMLTRLKYEIIPLLKEYLRDGIFKEKGNGKKTEDFIEDLISQYD